MDDFQSSEEVR